MSKPADTRPRPEQKAAQRNRDAAFARITRARRLAILGAGALTAVVAAVVSAVSPGHSLGAKAPARLRASATRSGGGVRSTSPGKMPALASPGQLGLQGPNSAPQSAPQTQPQTTPAPSAPVPAPAPSGPAVSGGS
jgi:hypothetical protein